MRHLAIVAVVLVPGPTVAERVALGVTLLAPALATVGACIAVVRALVLGRQAGTDESTGLLEVAGALRSGRTLRSVVADLSPEARRVVDVGASPAAVARVVGSAFPNVRRAATAATAILDTNGGPAAPVFEELALQASEEANVRREVRAAVAAPVLQGVVLVAIPLIGLLRSIATGALWEVIGRSPAHAGLVSVGVALVAAGSLWVVLVIRGALR